MSQIELPADLPGPWETVGELVELLPADWVLIGGLMVQLHAWEGGMTNAALVRAGFKSSPPDFDGYAHRYVRDELIVDVLAPDGIRPPATLDGSLKAVGVPGGSQALARAETVTVRIGEHAFKLRRPNLLGAV